MTPIHSQVKNALLPVMLTATGELRDTIAKQNKDPVPYQEEVVEIYKKLSVWSSDYARLFLSLACYVNGKDPKPWHELMLSTNPTGMSLALMACVKFHAGVYCVSHALKRKAFSPAFGVHDVPPKFEVASDGEVEAWLDGLSPKALKTILIQSEFQQALASLFESPTESKLVEIDLAHPQVGDIVTRGVDWRPAQLGDQDGGQGKRGKIIEIHEEDGWVRVKWDHDGSTNSYRMSEEDDIFHLDIVERPAPEARKAKQLM